MLSYIVIKQYLCTVSVWSIVSVYSNITSFSWRCNMEKHESDGYDSQGGINNNDRFNKHNGFTYKGQCNSQIWFNSQSGFNSHWWFRHKADSTILCGFISQGGLNSQCGYNSQDGFNKKGGLNSQSWYDSQDGFSKIRRNQQPRRI